MSNLLDLNNPLHGKPVSLYKFDNGRKVKSNVKGTFVQPLDRHHCLVMITEEDEDDYDMDYYVGDISTFDYDEVNIKQ